MRAALYARYSTDRQNDMSAADQLAACRRHAEAIGAHVVREFADEGISGTSMANRPGVRALMAFVEAGGCDLVIGEHTNRLARDGEDGWAIFHRLRALGVAYVTAEEGKVTVLHQGLSSLLSEMKIEETHHKTRRGMRGRVEAGRNVSAPPFGYRKRRAYDAEGEPLRGLMEIDPEKAAIVRRIFADYAAGVTPWAIARSLNAEGLAAPRGGLWSASAIAGHPRTGRGVVFNELYRGVRVWGRRTSVKDRRSGTRRDRAQPDPAEVVRAAVPELRIVDEATWTQVLARHAERARPGIGGRPAGKPGRLLSGLIVCGGCGAPMNFAGPGDYLRCARRIDRGVAEARCSNRRTPRYADIEAQVTAELQAGLLHPEVVAEAVRLLRDGLRAAGRDADRRRARLEAELAEVGRRLDRLVDQVEAGVPWRLIAARHAELEARREALKAELDGGGAEIVDLHPNAWKAYLDYVENLRASLEAGSAGEDVRARAAVLALIAEIRVTPAPGKGRYTVATVAAAVVGLDETAHAVRA